MASTNKLFSLKMTKWHAHVEHMAKHMNVVGSSLWWGALGHFPPPKSGADSNVQFFKICDQCSIQFLIMLRGKTSGCAESQFLLQLHFVYKCALFASIVATAQRDLNSCAAAQARSLDGTLYVTAHRITCLKRAV